jgi:peroxiredoxin Q/BCP
MTTLSTGDKAPDFSAKDQNGNTVSLSDFKGKKSGVVFLPKR